MNEPQLVAHERTLLRDLIQRAAARARDEKLMGQTAPHARALAESTAAAARQEAETWLQSEQAAIEQETEESRAAIQARYDEEQAAAEAEFDAAQEEMTNRFEEEKEAARDAHKEGQWTINAVLERNTINAEERRRNTETKLTGILAKLTEFRREANDLWDEWDKYLASAPKTSAGPRDQNPRLSLRKSLVAIQEKLAGLKSDLNNLAFPKLLKGGRLTLAFVGLGLLVFAAFGLLAFYVGGYQLPVVLAFGLIAASVLAITVGMTVNAVLEFQTRRQVRALFSVYPGMCLAADSVAARCRQRLKDNTARYPREIAHLKKRHKRTLRQAKREARQARRAAKQRLDEALPAATEHYHQRKEDADAQLEADLLALDQERERRLTESQQVHDAAIDELETNYRRRMEEIEGGYDRVWQMTAKAWRHATAELRETLEAIWEESSRLFPAWADPCWADRSPAAIVPPALQFGQLHVGKEQIPEIIPEEEKLAPEAVEDFVLPAVCAFPDKASMLFLAQDAGRAKAVEALQDVLYRLLTCIPPGKVRFTILDPVGLGQNFAAFMHLADHDELLVIEPHLDRSRPHRAAPGRPDGAHGERHPEVSAQPLPDHQRLQRHGRRGGGAVSRPGRRQFPGQLQRRKRRGGW